MAITKIEDSAKRISGARRGAVRPRLVPPNDLERDPDGVWISRGAAPRFSLDFDMAPFAGAWVEFTASILTDAETVQPCIFISRADSDESSVALPFKCHLRGRGRWIGILPPDLLSVAFEPIDGPGRFRIDDFAITRLSERQLAQRAFPIDPVQAVKAVWWRLTGKRLRSRYYFLEMFLRPTAETYQEWLKQNDTVSREERAFMRGLIETWREPPLISVAMPVHDPRPAELKAAIRSVQRQLYPRWELCIADDASRDPCIRRILDAAARRDPRIRLVRRTQNGNISAASNDALELVGGPFTALMDHDDVLPPHALFYVARELVAHPEADLVYTDEDKVDQRGTRYDPHMKSDWNEELFYAQNYINHLSVYRTELLRRIGGFRIGYEGSQDHDLILRLLDHTCGERIRHVPRVLYHWRNYKKSRAFSGKQLAKAVAARQNSLRDFLARRGIAGEVGEGPFGFNRLTRVIPTPAPEVTVIVPTRDAAALLAVCARGILDGTDYPALRLVILDNESRERGTAELFAELRLDSRVTIMACPGPFNFSAMNNAAVRAAESELVAFVNNDIEVVEPGWLSELVRLVLDDDVAAAGAKLLYPDDHIQHGGIILGVGGVGGVGGVAGHSQLHAEAKDPGYFGRLIVPQFMSAVTGACMLVRRSAFLEVGGFDEAGLPIAFNDVDLCLKLRARGYKIAWTPYAKLYHHESASRGLDTEPEKRERFAGEVNTMLERWGGLLRRDPYYNPNLSLVSGHFLLKGLTPPEEAEGHKRWRMRLRRKPGS